MSDHLDYDWMPEALGIAAQCWCEEDTKHIEMDSRLGMVVAKTAFGTTRVVERELGEQLPRIC